MVAYTIVVIVILIDVFLMFHISDENEEYSDVWMTKKGREIFNKRTALKFNILIFINLVIVASMIYANIKYEEIIDIPIETKTLSLREIEEGNIYIKNRNYYVLLTNQDNNLKIKEIHEKKLNVIESDEPKLEKLTVRKLSVPKEGFLSFLVFPKAPHSEEFYNLYVPKNKIKEVLNEAK